MIDKKNKTKEMWFHSLLTKECQHSDLILLKLMQLNKWFKKSIIRCNMQMICLEITMIMITITVSVLGTKEDSHSLRDQ